MARSSCRPVRRARAARPTCVSETIERGCSSWSNAGTRSATSAPLSGARTASSPKRPTWRSRLAVSAHTGLPVAGSSAMSSGTGSSLAATRSSSRPASRAHRRCGSELSADRPTIAPPHAPSRRPGSASSGAMSARRGSSPGALEPLDTSPRRTHQPSPGRSTVPSLMRGHVQARNGRSLDGDCVAPAVSRAPCSRGLPVVEDPCAAELWLRPRRLLAVRCGSWHPSPSRCVRPRRPCPMDTRTTLAADRGRPRRDGRRLAGPDLDRRRC